MSDYRVRPATLDDVDTLVRHRLGMFTDMGTAFDAPVLEQLYGEWLGRMMPPGGYLAWLAVAQDGTIAAGVGIPLIPWPPGPRPIRSERVAFVYNVYTEPPHRKRGLARRLMETVHAWCQANGIGAVALNAAPAARHLYESMGYGPAPTPMMWKIT
jgi:GNAT superfamily N-acetyltransferase